MWRGDHSGSRKSVGRFSHAVQLREDFLSGRYITVELSKGFRQHFCVVDSTALVVFCCYLENEIRMTSRDKTDVLLLLWHREIRYRDGSVFAFGTLSDCTFLQFFLVCKIRGRDFLFFFFVLFF